MPTTSTPDRSRSGRRQSALGLIGLIAILGASLGAVLTASAAVPIDAGYRDHQYGIPNVPGGDDVTAPQNQSKLWFADGRWWALMLEKTSQTYKIYRFDMATQDWTSTGVTVDVRNRSHGDALWDGTSLWVASSYSANLEGTPRDLRVYKFSYNTTTKVWTAVAGFPKNIVGTSTTGTRNATIARDSLGHTWVVYTQDLRVRYSRSNDGGATWSAGADIPGMGNDATSEDVAAVATVSGAGVSGIGVMWSNQSATDDAFYYQVHVNGNPGVWQTREVVMGGVGTYTADNHISLKTAPDGRAIAAIKTGRNDDPSPNGSDPLIAVVRRSNAPNVAGAWSVNTVTNVTVKGTRPMLVLDSQNNQANVFLTDPTLANQGNQNIYRRTASLTTLDFGPAAIGTAVIKSTLEAAINDANSTKQAATAASGMLVLAADIPTRRYLHACIGGPCPQKPVANFTQNKTSGQAPLAVQFTDASTNSPTSWAWDFDNNGTTDSTAKNPLYTYLVSGTYSVKLTATNVAGSGTVTKTNLITVSPPPAPVADFTASPTSGPASLSVQFTDTSTNGPTSWAWDFDNNGTTDSTAKNPPHVYNTPGTYTVKLTATNETGSSSKTRANYITVSVAPKTAFFPVDPVRLLDTRTGNGLSGQFTANVARTWTVGGRGGIPADAIAVTGNLTVVGQTKAGYLSIGPVAGSLGTTSSLNFPVGDVRANGVTIPLSGTGTLSAIYKPVAGAKTHVIFDVTGYFRATVGTGATYHDVNPVRLLDTRIGNGLTGTFVSGTPRTWQITGRGGIPAGATAITANLTVVNQTAAGYVSLGPVATANPSTSTINFPLGDVRANGVTVKLSASGTLSAVYRPVAGARTHLLLDVTGYFTNDASGTRFVAVSPARVLDTRIGNGLAGTFKGNTPRTWTVGGRGGIDANAVAVVGNVTVVGQTNGGYVSVTPVATANPSTSTINFPVGDVRANGMTVKLGTGKLSGVYKPSSGASTHLLYDVFGYYK